MNSLEEIADRLKTLRSAVIFTHMRPDGDTLGSGMALHRALSMLGVRSEVVNEGEIPDRYFFLEGMREIRSAPSRHADAYIAVDTSNPSRLGALEAPFTAGARRIPTINIDHHISNTRFGTYNYVRERSSNCENIAQLLPLLGVRPDKRIADYLMLGMITDSGNFTHSDVDGDTFRAAAYAADYGADADRIAYESLKKQTKARAKMYAEVISSLRYFSDDRLAIAVAPLALLEKYALPPHATEGIVDFALTIDTVEVSVCLMEVKSGQYKASFRSKGKVDVNRVAAGFGGGGHVLASGCMFFGELEEIYDKIRYAVLQNSEEA